MLNITPTDLIWVQTGFLGDIVLTTAAIALGRQSFPDARHHIVTTPIGAEALRDWVGLDSVIAWDKRRGDVWQGFQATRSLLRARLGGSRAITLRAHPSTRSALLAQTLGYPVISHRESSLSSLATHSVDRVAPLHEAHRIALLLEPLGVARADIVSARPVLTAVSRPSAAWATQVAALPPRRIGIAPGSVWGTKRWREEGFRELLARLLANDDNAVVLIGGPEETALVQKIIGHHGQHPRLVDCAGKTKLRELSWLIPQLSVLVANDSAPVHFASAFQVPTVAIFGATLSQMGFGPLAPKSVVLQIESLPCRPCGTHGPQVCPLTHFKCMRDMSVDQVFRAVQSIEL